MTEQTVFLKSRADMTGDTKLLFSVTSICTSAEPPDDLRRYAVFSRQAIESSEADSYTCQVSSCGSELDRE